jgi:hypothetical protein
MGNELLVRRLIYGALLLALAPGCQVFRSGQPVSVLALDAETKKPVPDADVRIFYPLTPAYRAPAEASGKTGADGATVLHAAPTDEGLAMEATAPGYLYEQKSLNADAVPAPKAFLPFGAPAPHVAPLVIELYALPGPTIELVLPLGYRGVVRVAVEPRDNVPCPPGLRRFRYEVPPSGEVQAIGPALLRRTPEIVASYANGVSLSPQVRDGEIGFLWVNSDGACEVYVVGTPIERDSLRRSDHKERMSKSSGDGQKSGSGRKGRRGSQAPSDSSADSPNP